MLQTENVTGFAVEGGAGRDPANVGKFHLHLELLFDTADEAEAWMKANGIPTLIFDAPDVPR